MLIGANDYGFADIVADVRDRLADVAVVVEELLPGRLEHHRDVLGGEHHARSPTTCAPRSSASSRRWRTAGYADEPSTRSSPRPTRRRCRGRAGFRYGETGFTRQTIGGCGVWNSDADWARNTVVNTLNNTIRNAVSGMSNVQVLDMAEALAGRKLCENTVGLLEEKGVATWRAPGAVDKTEWVQQIRTLTTLFPPYQLQEDAHPNYWGQLALRNCFRQAYNGGAPQGGTCSRGTGLNGKGEPNMALGG